MKIIKFLQSLWPAWFPYPSAWLQAVLMMFVAIGPMAAVIEFVGWRLDRVTSLPGVGVALLCLIGGSFLAFIPYAYGYSFLLGDCPKGWPRKLPSPKSISEALFGLTTLALSFSIGVSVSLLFARIEIIGYNDIHIHGIEEGATAGALAWFLSATYLYHFKILTWRGILQELRKKVENDLSVGVRPSEENPFSGLDLNLETSKSTPKTPQKPSRTSAKVPPKTVSPTQCKSRQTIKK